MRLLLLLLAFTGNALAQYNGHNGPAVETCRTYARQDVARDGARVRDVVFERDQDLSIARYTRKVGNQFVSSLLRGNGAVVYDGTPSAEFSFVCLLADDKRAVFFEWLPRQNVPSLTQCTRDAALRDKPRPCLETLLQVAEQDLLQRSAVLFQQARERDQDDGGAEKAAEAFRKANSEWRQYRDAECARRRDSAAKGVSPEDQHLSCLVDLTRRRSFDMR